MRSSLLVLLVFVCLPNLLRADVTTVPAKEVEVLLDQATAEIYKSIEDVELKIYIFNPKNHKPSDQRPAIIFFFGGGWKGGDPKQFANQCKYLSDRGMVAMTADYRVASRHGVKAIDCVADAKSAIRWVRTHAARLGVDPNRIAAGGGSAGGHLAACAGVVAGYENASDAGSISSIPNAMVLFNPALVLDNLDGETPIPEAKLEELRTRIGDEPKNISPAHHVKSGLSPTIIFHGKGDTTVPYRTAEVFTEAMHKAGNRCELVGFENQKHGFFNFGRDDNSSYKQTVAAMDRFLVSLGYLPPAAESK